LSKRHYLGWNKNRIRWIEKKLNKWLLKNHSQHLLRFRQPRTNEIYFETEEGGSGNVKFEYINGKWIIKEIE
jgi:hypothetical protein